MKQIHRPVFAVRKMRNKEPSITEFIMVTVIILAITP